MPWARSRSSGSSSQAPRAAAAPRSASASPARSVSFTASAGEPVASVVVVAVRALQARSRDRWRSRSSASDCTVAGDSAAWASISASPFDQGLEAGFQLADGDALGEQAGVDPLELEPDGAGIEVEGARQPGLGLGLVGEDGAEAVGRLAQGRDALDVELLERVHRPERVAPGEAELEPGFAVGGGAHRAFHQPQALSTSCQPLWTSTMW